MERGGLPCAFHHRPLVSAAAGLLLGVILACSLNGTLALLGACLFFALCAAAAPLGAGYLRPFLLGCGAGLFRVGLLLFSLPGGVMSPQLKQALILNNQAIPAALQPVRQALSARCNLLFGESAAMARAILLGDRSALAYGQTEAFRQAGVSHILALSGLHVSALTGVILLPLPRSKPRLRAGAACLFLTLYCALAGFPSSLLRAAVMTLPLLFAPLFRRKHDTASAMCLAFLILVLLQPMSMFSAGFCLSFSAVAGIAMLYPRIMALLRKLPNHLSSPVSVTLSATFGTLPFTVLFFGALPLYSLFSNLLVVPVMTAGLAFAFAALFLSFAWLPLGTVLAIPSRLLLGAGEAVADGFSRLPGAMLQTGGLPPISLLLYALALLFLSRYCLLNQKNRYGAAGVLLLFSCAAAILP